MLKGNVGFLFFSGLAVSVWWCSLDPPGQVSLRVVKHGEGQGPALWLEAPGSVCGGCPAGGGESPGPRGTGAVCCPGEPVAAREGRGKMAEQRPSERRGTVLGHAPLWRGAAARLRDRGWGGCPPLYFSSGAPLFWWGMYICKWPDESKCNQM